MLGEKWGGRDKWEWNQGQKRQMSRRRPRRDWERRGGGSWCINSSVLTSWSGTGGRRVQEKWQLPQGSLPPPSPAHTLTPQKHFLPIPRIRDRFPKGSFISPTIIPCGLHNWPIHCLHMFFHDSERENMVGPGVGGWYAWEGLGAVRLGERGETTSQALQGHPENNCKLCSMQTWVMVSSVLLRPGLQLCPPGLRLYLRSGNWRASRQVFPGLYMEAGRKERRSSPQFGSTITSRNVSSGSSKRKPQAMT